MSLVNFTNLDFEDVKSTLKEYLKSNSNFTDYDFEGSNLSSILDVLAYNTYITSYNANMVANEVFIDTATLRENVIALARNIGYTPKSRKAATSSITFFVDTTNITPVPASLTLRKGTVVASQGVFGGTSGAFCILDDITVPVVNSIASFNDITIYEGTVIEKNFTYSDRNPQQKFILPNIGIDTELIRVGVKNNASSTATVKYSLQDNLFYIGSQSKVYFLQEVSDERYELFFGDGSFGKKLDDQNYITVTYLTSNGDAGNGFSQFSFNGRITYARDGNEYTVTTGISLITPEFSSRGGSAIEAVESVRKYAPKIYSTQNRAVTADDYETLIPARIYPDTESVSVFGGEDLNPPQYGKVFIAIKPAGGSYLSNFVKSSIISDLKNFTVAGIVPQIIDLKYLYVEVDSNVYYNTNLFPSAPGLKTNIFESLEAYSKTSELNAYGARLKYSKLLGIIDGTNSAITSNITTVRMRRDMRPSVNEFAEYEICFGNRFHVSDGPNIRTSGFLVEGYSGEVFLSDVPYSDGKTGSIDLIRLISPSEKQVLRQNVGTIDYIKGEILLSPIKIINTSKTESEFPIIEIEANPYSNDIIGLQDLFLQLDISKSNVTVIPDTISNGADISGSRYTVSSSFINDNITR